MHFNTTIDYNNWLQRTTEPCLVFVLVGAASTWRCRRLLALLLAFLRPASTKFSTHTLRYEPSIREYNY